MILDNYQRFSDTQVLAATAVSTNVLDTSLDRDIGIGEPMAVVVNVIVAADVADADETYEFQVQSGSTDTPVTIVARSAFGGVNEPASSVLAAGFKVVIPLPHGTTVDRYLRVNYVLGGTTPSITVSTFLSPLSMVQANAAYPDGFTIS
jgi:hypothetical protein